MSRSDPELARSRARLGALTVHARHDPRVTTAPARAAFLRRFERAVDESDPDGRLDPAERARRIAYLRRLYFARLAHQSRVARAARARAKRPWLETRNDSGPAESNDGR